MGVLYPCTNVYLTKISPKTKKLIKEATPVDLY
uniref:Uncharacterized protein n=1 Tax=Rhizophora mucronata TaxID=61149 RepID=A0A2P2PQF0_RHIMU